MSIRFASFLLVITYLIAVTVASPIGIFANLLEVYIQHENFIIERSYCIEQWPTPSYRHYYSLLTLGIHFVGPLLLTCIFYWLIFRRLQQRVNAVKKCRSTVMLATVVVVFTLTWTPFHLFSLISEFSYSSIKGRYFKFIDVMVRGVAMSSSCLNPLIYGWFNEVYRTSFFELIRRTCFIKADDSSRFVTSIVILTNLYI